MPERVSRHTAETALERFHEEGESAESTDRSQLQKLLTYCRLNKGRVHFVVVFNLTRFARDKYDHFAELAPAIAWHLTAFATAPIDDTAFRRGHDGAVGNVRAEADCYGSGSSYVAVDRNRNYF